MLPRANRLTLKSDFQKVLKNKSFVHSNFFTAASLDNNASFRLGIIVANKVSKRSTERNRIKRIVREVAYQYINSQKSLDIVVLTKPQAAEVEGKILIKDVEKIFKKLL